VKSENLILSVADMRGDPSVLCGVFGMVCNGFGARTRPPAPDSRPATLALKEGASKALIR